MGGGQQGPVGGGSSPACLPSPGAPRMAALGPPPLAPQRRQLAPAVTEAAALSSRILFPEALGWPWSACLCPDWPSLCPQRCPSGLPRGFREAVAGVLVWGGLPLSGPGSALSSWVTSCPSPPSLHLETGAHVTPATLGQEGAGQWGWSEVEGSASSGRRDRAPPPGAPPPGACVLKATLAGGLGASEQGRGGQSECGPAPRPLSGLFYWDGSSLPGFLLPLPTPHWHCPPRRLSPSGPQMSPCQEAPEGPLVCVLLRFLPSVVQAPVVSGCPAPSCPAPNPRPK